MRFTQSIIVPAIAAMAMAVSTSPTMAHGYNGNTNLVVPDAHSYTGAWPVTITRSQRSNGTGCLTLSQNGRHGGLASLVFGGFKYPFGSFVIVNGILMANIVEPLYGQNGALLFTGHASQGNIGPGLFENSEDGSNFDFGALAFGAKNGC